MAETGAPLAGEMSGHIFFADRYYGFDDALYAAVRLLNVARAQRPRALAEMRDELPRVVNTPGAALRLRRGAQVRGRRRGARRGSPRPAPRSTTSTACACSTRRRLVAAARLEHAGRAGRALRGARTRPGSSGSRRSLAAELRKSGIEPPSILSVIPATRGEAGPGSTHPLRGPRSSARLARDDSRIRHALLLLRHVARRRRAPRGHRPRRSIA